MEQLAEDRFGRTEAIAWRVPCALFLSSLFGTRFQVVVHTASAANLAPVQSPGSGVTVREVGGILQCWTCDRIGSHSAFFSLMQDAAEAAKAKEGKAAKAAEAAKKVAEAAKKDADALRQHLEKDLKAATKVGSCLFNSLQGLMSAFDD